MFATLAAWLHDLDPFAIGFVRWSGLSYLLGFVLGYFWPGPRWVSCLAGGWATCCFTTAAC